MHDSLGMKLRNRVFEVTTKTSSLRFGNRRLMNVNEVRCLDVAIRVGGSFALCVLEARNRSTENSPFRSRIIYPGRISILGFSMI